jgi:hypothetical protein
MVLPISTLAMSVPSGSASASPSATFIFNCVHRQVRPTSVVITCADSGLYIEGITWRNWGGTTASASGTLKWNDCTPSCAGGQWHSKPIAFVARHPRVIAGVRVYTQLVGPAGSWGGAGRTWNLPTRAL